MKSLYWFTQDLRLTDNHAFAQAVEESDELDCVVLREHIDSAHMGRV